jgi:hypothetical protein
MKEAKQLWSTLLQLSLPWTVTRYESDHNEKRYDIWIEYEKRRGWLGFGRLVSGPVERYSWRHVNYEDWQTHVHVTLPKDADLSRHSWAGDRDMPMSKGLSNQIFALLRAGCSLRVVHETLHVSVADVWRFRYFIDNGHWASKDQVVNATEKSKPKVRQDGDLPAEDDPVWMSVLVGRLPLDIKVLGLKLQMTRLRNHLIMTEDPKTHTLKATEFYSYCVKNKHLLAYELEQIKRSA